jgi:hypothetical protein
MSHRKISCSVVDWRFDERGSSRMKTVSAEFSLSNDGSILFYGMEDGTIRALNTATPPTEPPTTPPTPAPTTPPIASPTSAPTTPPTASPTTSAPVDAPVSAPVGPPGSYAAHVNIVWSSVIVGLAAILAAALG